MATDLNMNQEPNDVRIFTWDWKESPDLDDIGRAVTEISGGTVFITNVDTGSDQFAVVVSATELTAAQATEAFNREWYREEDMS